MEITFIILAGMLPVGLAIYNVLKSDKQEKELKDRQQQLISTQNSLIEKQEQILKLQITYADEIKQKTNEVIELQNKLDEKSELQINNLTRLVNPIPEKANITFESDVIVSDNDFKDLMSDIKLSGVQTGNLLPTRFITSKPIINKINQFKDVLLTLNVTLKNQNGKTININKRVTPKFLGYDKTDNLDHFIMSYNEDKGKEISFTGFHLDSDVGFNHGTGSFLEFKDPIIEVSFQFATPVLLKFGNQADKKYKLDSKFIDLNLKTLSIGFKGYSTINCNKFERIGTNRFRTKLH